MGVIIYKGKEYSYDTIPPIIANAIILTPEEAEKYNILLSPEREEAVELSNGERIFVGDPWNNFVASGYNIVQAASEEDFRNKIQPSDAYTYFTFKITFQSQILTYKIVIVNKDFTTNQFTIGFQGTAAPDYSSERYLVPTIQQLQSENETFEPCKLTFSSPPSAYGVVLRAKNFSTKNSSNSIIVEPYLAGWTYDAIQQKYTLLDLKKLEPFVYGSRNVNINCFVIEHTDDNKSTYPQFINNFLFASNAEYDYAMGIKGKYTYVNQKEFEEAVSGAVSD